MVGTHDLVPLHIGERLLAVDADELGLALDDVLAVDGADGEVVAFEGEDLLAQGEGDFARVVVFGVLGLRAQGWIHGCEGGRHGCGG